MNSATGSTPNGLPHDHRWLTAWVLDKNHNVTKDEYHLLFCYKNCQLEKTTTKLRQMQLYFCWAFALFHQGIVITDAFKILHTFLLKRQSKHYTIIKFCHSNNSDEKDLTA